MKIIVMGCELKTISIYFYIASDSKILDELLKELSMQGFII